MSGEQAGPPAVVPEAGWTPIEPFRLEGGAGSFVTGRGRDGEQPEDGRLRVRYFLRADDSRLVGRAWFGPGAQGPPGHAHGGAIAAVLDEAMGAAAWVAGHIAVAARLDTSFLRMLPLGTDATLEAWVEREEGRKVWTSGRLLDGAGEPFAAASGLFIELPPERFRPLLEQWANASGADLEQLLSTAFRKYGVTARPSSRRPSKARD
ncbi:MAG TPA: PaaI family thioesterase [Thermoanaerobaculia bacterium]|nr:PaaI family thioesterase [Thermoanaerobaculia bacterium]